MIIEGFQQSINWKNSPIYRDTFFQRLKCDLRPFFIKFDKTHLLVISTKHAGYFPIAFCTFGWLDSLDELLPFLEYHPKTSRIFDLYPEQRFHKLLPMLLQAGGGFKNHRWRYSKQEKFGQGFVLFDFPIMLQYH